MIEVSIILLLLRSILSPLGIYFQLTKLSGDFELNPGPKEGFNQCFFYVSFEFEQSFLS